MSHKVYIENNKRITFMTKYNLKNYFNENGRVNRCELFSTCVGRYSKKYCYSGYMTLVIIYMLTKRSFNSKLC